MRPLEVGDVRDPVACRRWADEVDAIAHLAASISVQDSIDDPRTTFDNDVVGTFNLLEAARAAGTRLLFMSTCMVYDRARTPAGIDEDHPTGTGLAVRRLEAGRRGADALVSPRLWPADDGRPAVQHLRAVPALGRGGRGGGDLHPALAGGRAAAHLRRRDADPRPAVRHRLRPVRRRRVALRCGRRAGAERRDRGGRLGQRPGGGDRAGRRRGSSTSSTSTHRARSRSCAATRRRAEELLGWTPAVGLDEGLGLVRAWMAERTALGIELV